MNETVKVRIKRGTGDLRTLHAARALAAAGYRPAVERRNGHPVAVWVR